MKEFTVDELNEILNKHRRWLSEDCDGWETMRANLRGANLSGANLYGANLCEADLRGADLRGANLHGANLHGADLRGANLYGANLRGADLSRANLYGADLREANLRGANLYGANLCEADLCEADLRGADLYEADLRGADLYGADLSRANLYGADLREAKNIPYIPMACPDAGCFIGWKKASGHIIKLFIPSDAKRSSATGRKCRCNKATVVAIENIDGTPTDILEVPSDYDRMFTYKLHGHVEVLDFDDDRFNECSPGIHFFINRQEAVEY